MLTPAEPFTVRREKLKSVCIYLCCHYLLTFIIIYRHFVKVPPTQSINTYRLTFSYKAKCWLTSLQVLSEAKRWILLSLTDVLLSLFVYLGVYLYVSYQCTSWAAVAILTGADPGVNASPARGAALGPGTPRGPEDRLRTGHPFIAEPMEMAVVGEEVAEFERIDCNNNTIAVKVVDLSHKK